MTIAGKIRKGTGAPMIEVGVEANSYARTVTSSTAASFPVNVRVMFLPLKPVKSRVIVLAGSILNAFLPNEYVS